MHDAGTPAGNGVLVRCTRQTVFVVILVAFSICAVAKDSTTAIVLFDGPHGAAYVQLTGVTLNGKTELRVCDQVASFDKVTYKNFLRVPLSGASSLQRAQDGVLTLTVNGKPVCVVPSNLKFDSKAEFTPAEAAENILLQGTVVGSSGIDVAIPEFKPGVQVFFVTAPDAELADFLRAQRANTVAGWEDFLARHPTSSRVADARLAIAGLHEKAAEVAFAEYEKSNGQNLPMLRETAVQLQAAHEASSGYEPSMKLMEAIAREVDRLLQTDRDRLENFETAFRDHRPGYGQLAAARVHVEQLLTVRPHYPALLNVRRDIATEERKLELAVLNAETLASSGRYDDAISALGPYRCFSSEIPRIDAILRSAYKYHFDRGQRMAAGQDWGAAIIEFRSAATIRPDSKEANAALENANFQLTAQRNREQARLALEKSNEYVRKNQFVEAYEVLAELPDDQRALVNSQLSALARNYVGAATRRAQLLQEVHLPIKGRADEDAVQQAYALLNRVSSLNGDPATTLKRDFLSSKISSYYLDEADQYLQKPSGSGAGIGCLYLKQAQRYAITNVDAVKDQAAKYAALCRRRAGLSVGIVLRDQTSRADNPGFADQLADAIANGLESSGAGVEVVRKPSDAGDAMQPNFMIIGEVLDHRVVKSANVEAPESRYRAATHETKNPGWVQTNNDYASAQQQLATAQRALADAQSQHKKKDVIAAANDAVEQAQKHVDELRHKLETTDQNRVEAIVEPYHYTRKTIDVSASIQVALRVTDRAGDVIGDPVAIHKSNHKAAVVLQDVKPEDTEGITNQGVEPNEAQYLTDLEVEIRDLVVAAVRAKAADLPSKFLQEARNHAQRGDVDGAAEQYILYLNSTPDTAPDRDEAAKFLAERFNVGGPANSKL